MSHAGPVTNPSPRALMLGPAFLPDLFGGLHLALCDVVDQLSRRGWQVDTQIQGLPTRGNKPENSPAPSRQSILNSNLAVFHRRPEVLEKWLRAIPPSIRRILSTSFMPHAYFEQISHDLDDVERVMARARDYDVVLCCLDAAPQGFGALVASGHDRVAIISLADLGLELGAHWFRWGRLLARWHLREQMNPFLFRRVTPAEVQLAIFGSAQWQREAVRSGLPLEKARTIYFGVPFPESLPRSSQTHNRILWVGRLSPEKGLHLLLPAMPAIRQRIGQVTLTIIAGGGSNAYRQLILEMIRKYRLEDVTNFLPAMERSALQNAYATHDVLFFHSIFAEPVSLVLMEALASGLPVVASRARAEAKLLQDNVTCLCYQPADPRSLVDAVVTMLSDDRMRQRLAANGRELVRQEFSLDKMGQAYDEVLRRFIGN